MKISGKTKVYGIIGDPVGHSLSPLMQNAAFSFLGIDSVYVPFPVESKNLKFAINGLRALGVSGFNATIPHKTELLRFVDEISEEAKIIGAANTVVNRNGKLTAYNTDGEGFVKSLEEEGVDATGKNVLIIGAGGAARGVAFALAKNGAEKIAFTNRTHERAVSLSGEYASKIKECSFEAISGKELAMRYPEFEVVINGTAVGLTDGSSLKTDFTAFAGGTTVCDLMYHETEFLKEARKAGLKTIDGKGMLLHQGALAFNIWFGIDAPIEVMRKALDENAS